jgi:hypothetical protein
MGVRDVSGRSLVAIIGLSFVRETSSPRAATSVFSGGCYSSIPVWRFAHEPMATR